MPSRSISRRFYIRTVKRVKYTEKWRFIVIIFLRSRDQQVAVAPWLKKFRCSPQRRNLHNPGVAAVLHLQ